MKMWIIAAIVCITLLFGIVAVSAIGSASAQAPAKIAGCSSCGNACTAGNNCGLATCGAVNGGTCGCGKK